MKKSHFARLFCIFRSILCIDIYLLVIILYFSKSLCFECLSETKALITIDDGMVNDDYCDCLGDGKDELLTSACSQISNMFYCNITHFHQKKLFTSNICDCCDGSDERVGSTPTTNCPYVCDEYLKNDAIEIERNNKILKNGHSIYLQRLKGLKRMRLLYISNVQNYTELIKYLDKYKKKLTLLKKDLEIPQYYWRIEVSKSIIYNDDYSANHSPFKIKNKQKPLKDINKSDYDYYKGKNWEYYLKKSTSQKYVNDIIEGYVKGIVQINSTQYNFYSFIKQLEFLKSKRDAEYKREISISKKRQSSGLGPILNGGKIGIIRGKRFLVQLLGILFSPITFTIDFCEYVFNQICKLINKIPHIDKVIVYIREIKSKLKINRILYINKILDLLPYSISDRIIDNYMKITNHWFWDEFWNSPYRYYKYYFPTINKNIFMTDYDILSSIINTINTQKDTINKSISEMNEWINNYNETSTSFGLYSFYYDSSNENNKCYEKVIDKYKYTVCPLKEVRQDYTSLGSFDKWDNTTRSISYTKGKNCFGGLDRSTIVHFECGIKDEIVSVNELSKCVYDIVFKTPNECFN